MQIFVYTYSTDGLVAARGEYELVSRISQATPYVGKSILTKTLPAEKKAVVKDFLVSILRITQNMLLPQPVVGAGTWTEFAEGLSGPDENPTPILRYERLTADCLEASTVTAIKSLVSLYADDFEHFLFLADPPPSAKWMCKDYENLLNACSNVCQDAGKPLEAFTVIIFAETFEMLSELVGAIKPLNLQTFFCSWYSGCGNPNKAFQYDHCPVAVISKRPVEKLILDNVAEETGRNTWCDIIYLKFSAVYTMLFHKHC